MVAGYYTVIDRQEAIESCEYKTLTVCKGSCFITERIKVVSSNLQENDTKSPLLELSMFKDLIFVDDAEFLRTNIKSITTNSYNVLLVLHTLDGINNQLFRPPMM